MKYLTLILLTFSIPVLAGGLWPSPSSGGSGDSSATSTNYNTNLNGAASNSDSSSTSGAISGSLSGAVSGSSVGDVTATGGNQSQSTKSKVKDSGNSNQSQASNSKGGNSANEYSTSYYSAATEATAASAASISSIGCQTGMSGQSKNIGISALTDSPLCEALKMVEVHTIKYHNTSNVEDKDYHLAAIHKYLEKADEYVDDTYTTGKWATIFNQVGQILLWVALASAGL